MGRELFLNAIAAAAALAAIFIAAAAVYSLLALVGW